MFSWPYAHLLINHFPVVLSVSALGVSIMALLINRRGLWLTAMGALTLAGLFVYPVHLTGIEADEALKNPWYVHSGAIESHEDAGTLAMYVILVVGVFAAYSWWRSLKSPVEGVPGWMRAGICAGALAACASALIGLRSSAGLLRRPEPPAARTAEQGTAR